MEQRTRTFKSLAVLALAMTGGATLLAWAEPRARDYAAGRATGSAPLVARRLARQAVGNGPSDKTIQCDRIEIVPLNVIGAPSRGTLAATRLPGAFHFLVGGRGDIQALPLWNTLTDSTEAGVIRVAFADDSASARVPAAQWWALRALLGALGERAQGGIESLPVRLQAAHDHFPAAEVGLRNHLRSLLLEDGFVEGRAGRG